jgi:hypothetical protein
MNPSEPKSELRRFAQNWTSPICRLRHTQSMGGWMRVVRSTKMCQSPSERYSAMSAPNGSRKDALIDSRIAFRPCLVNCIKGQRKRLFKCPFGHSIHMKFRSPAEQLFRCQSDRISDPLFVRILNKFDEESRSGNAQIVHEERKSSNGKTITASKVQCNFGGASPAT